MGKHIDEDEGEDADGEHRQRDPGTTAEQPHTAHGQPEEDGEAGKSSE
jgi:hypothetical protein